MPTGKPLIGLTCTVRYEDGAVLYGLYASYIKALEAAGGLPVLIAHDLQPETLRAIYERVDGVLLTGGGDVDPHEYGAGDEIPLRSVNHDRDATEMTVTKWAVADDKPLLGICRGVQVMNVALGGTLYRDLALEFGNSVDHDMGGKNVRNFEAHAVNVQSDSKLAGLLGTTQPKVNSLHHQAIRDLGKGLVPVATAPDGIVEGVEIPGTRFIVGVQWHPEELANYSEPMRRLFEGFVRQASGQ
jgi:putative glutamine amidotransferase